MTELMVKQWSFCEKCKGKGCSECDNGRVVALIPLSSLKTARLREEYSTRQKDFIKQQEVANASIRTKR